MRRLGTFRWVGRLGTFRLAPGALPHSGMRLGDVPAVSMALRRVDRLRAANIAGVPWKFARKLARPPDCFRDGWAEVIWFRPYWFLVRAGGGVTDEGILYVGGVGPRRALPAPA